jgi:hypothetical protein
MQTEGAEVAYATALEICRDKKAPAPARAACATLIMRGGGYLTTPPSELAAKEPHQMTPAELQTRIEQLRADQARRLADGEFDDLADGEPDDGVFE